MINQLPLPPFFDETKRLGGVSRRTNYNMLAELASKWRKDHGIRPSGSDKLLVSMLIIDAQQTFCEPDAELYVGGKDGRGAIDDNLRLAEFIYKWMSSITSFTLTLDTHLPFQIFHPAFWEDSNGNNPPVYTMISVDDVINNKWTVTEAAAFILAKGNLPALKEYAIHYVKELARKGQYSLMIWPYHAMLGGNGHALAPEIEEAVFFHSLVRGMQPNYEIKGGNPLTENYSVIKPEVTEQQDGRAIAVTNVKFLESLEKNDVVIIAGQAKSHCVAWTIEHLLREIQAKDPALASKVYLLGDCSSPVVTPAFDFTDIANDAYQRFANAGMHLVNSTDDINNWQAFK